MMQEEFVHEEPWGETADAFIEVTAGGGGQETNDWAWVLLRMYRLYARQCGYQCGQVYHDAPNPYSSRSFTLPLYGKHAYGALQEEAGVHRRVRCSPFDSAKRRHTVFAAVGVGHTIEEARRGADKDDTPWADQIRVYVLDPYKLAKDLRTGAETEEVEAVLDGQLDLLIRGGAMTCL